MFVRLPQFLCFLCFSISTFAQQDPRLAAREELNKGVAAFRGANYEEAIQHFNSAVHWDPEMKVAHLYLATAYAQQYVPGVDSDANVALGRSALEQYAEVLRRDSTNVTAFKGSAYLNLQMKNFDEARAGYKKVTELDPNDAEAWYSAGVVDWTMVYREVMEEKAKLKSDSEYALILSAACKTLREQQLANIEDGLAMLTHAVSLRKDYGDAMVYLNLLYRLRADLDCGDKAAHAADLRTANEWSEKAMAARKRRAEASTKSN